jgi:hypothetical protein
VFSAHFLWFPRISAAGGVGAVGPEGGDGWWASQRLRDVFGPPARGLRDSDGHSKIGDVELRCHVSYGARPPMQPALWQSLYHVVRVDRRLMGRFRPSFRWERQAPPAGHVRVRLVLYAVASADSPPLPPLPPPAPRALPRCGVGWRRSRTSTFLCGCSTSWAAHAVICSVVRGSLRQSRVFLFLISSRVVGDLGGEAGPRRGD